MIAPFLAGLLSRRPRAVPARAHGMTSAILALLLAPLASAAGQGGARCDDTERVRRIEIEGARIATDELQLVLATQEPSLAWRVLRVGEAPCADSVDVAQDALRIAVLHRQRGWFRAQVRPAVQPMANGSVVRFTVDAGPVARLRSVTPVGLPPADSSALAPPLVALAGQVFDRVRVQAVADRAVRALQDAGYARAALRRSEVVIDSTAAEADLTLHFDAGARFRIGEIVVETEPVRGREPRYDDATVARLAGLEAGTRYRASDVLAAQARLYRTDAFRLVLLDTTARAASADERERAEAMGAMPTDSVLDITINVADARTRSARVGAGWGTLECGRVQGRLTDRGFLGAGRRVELTARASRLGIGRPLDQLPGLCPQFLRDDPYSQELNYYVGVSLGNATFFGSAWAPTLDVYSERRGEYNAFQLETDIGVGLSLTRAWSPRTLIGAGAEFESGRIVTDAVLACVRFALCQPADFALARQGNTTQAVNAAWLHHRVGAAARPRDGGRPRAGGPPVAGTAHARGAPGAGRTGRGHRRP